MDGFRHIQYIEQDLMEGIVRKTHFEKRNSLKKIELNGSARQGSISSSLFNPSCRENGEKICKEVDLDLQLSFKIGIDKASCLEDVQGKLGLVSIKTHCGYSSFGYFNYTLIEKTDLIQHFHVKELILKQLSIREKREVENIKLLIAFYFRRQKRKFKTINIDWEDIISKATSQRFFDVMVDNKRYLKINMDLAFVFRTKFTPTILKEFGERTSYNLSRSVLDHLFIVAKSSHEEKSNKNTTEWSYSFCHIENHIFTDVFTDTHRLIYLVTKSIFKKHIQPLDNNLLTSYLMKTILFWRFENEKFSQDDWFDDAIILSQTHIMFEDLKRFLEKGFLPMYFIPKLNLIERMDTKLRKDVIDVIENKIQKSSFQELFDVEELKKALELIQEVKSALFYISEKLNSLNPLF